MGTTTDKRRFGGIERVYGPTAAQAFTRLHVTIVGMGRETHARGRRRE